MRDAGDDRMHAEADSTRSEAAGEPRLVFTSGPGRGLVFSLAGERTRIGRRSDNDIVIDAGLTVSGHHAVIYRDPGDGAWWVEDQGSKNGTWVNGERAERARLSDGDAICFARNGPEARFVTGEARIPGLFETTLTTFRRTRSFRRAMRELLPPALQRGGGSSVSRVERIIDDRLERLTRRTQWLVVALGGAALLAVVVAAGLVVGFLIPEGGGGDDAGVAVELVPEVEPIYGGLFFATREHPIGRVTVANRDARRLERLELSFEFLKEASDYLAEPFVAELPDLDPGASRTVDLLPRITAAVRSPRTHEVTAVLRLSSCGRVVKERVLAVYVHGANVFNWEDPKRIAAFVDPQDSAVRSLVREVLKVGVEEAAQDFPPREFRDAVSLVTALARLKLRYVPDAVRPTSEKIDARVSDQVNFPWETLLDRLGDCDDLSVLCAAVFEAVGIRAALAVGPTHVLAMFDSGVAVAGLESTPLEPETVIEWNGRVWIPIETTKLGQPGAGFTTVWSAAWPRRQEILAGEIEVVEMREAWKSFAPAPVNDELDEVARRKLSEAHWLDPISHAREVEEALGELRRLFQQNLRRKVEEIEEREAAGPARDRQVGILHARSGLFDSAAELFLAALAGPAAGGRDGIEAALYSLREGDDVPWLLFDLAACLTLGARNPRDLRLAVRCYEVGIERLPEGDGSPLAAEYLVRLALVHRLRGDLAAERRAAEIAFASAPALRETYDRMVRGVGGGPRAATPATAASLRQFVADGLR